MEVDATSHVHSNFKYEVDISSLLDSCRVCMAQSFNMSSIFDAEKENIIEEIQFCTGITIKQETGLPSQICELCLNNLSVAYKFKTSCLVADETFRKLIVTPVIKTEQPELIEYEYESIIDYKNANDDDFEVVKEELIEVVLNEDGERNSGGVKVKNRGLPLQIIGDIVIEHDNNQMEVDDGNLTIDHVQKPRQIIGVRLNKVPKTSAERGREFRARKALLKQQCKQQQEPDAIVEIATEDIQSAGPSEKNQVPEPSEITTIEKRAKSAEATRRWREKKKGVSESSKKQAKTAAQRMREYRERKKFPPPPRGRPRKSAATIKAPRKLKKFKFKRLCCEPCNMKFDTKEESDNHKRKVHKDSETWVCEICGKMFVHRASHYTHVKSHQPPQYACETCDYKTWHKYDLAKHKRIHTGLKMYQCEYCTASYYTSSNLTTHIRRLHMNEKPHDCNICQRTFFDRTKLNRHLDSHLQIKRFECDVCHACFTRRCYWKKHLLRQHEIVTPPQRPGRQKSNIVVGDYLEGNQDTVAEYYAKEGAAKKL